MEQGFSPGSALGQDHFLGIGGGLGLRVFGRLLEPDTFGVYDRLDKGMALVSLVRLVCLGDQLDAATRWLLSLVDICALSNTSHLLYCGYALFTAYYIHHGTGDVEGSDNTRTSGG